MRKLERIISFEDFKSNKKSIKEGVDEIIPEGLPDYTSQSKFGLDFESKITKVKEFISGADDDILEEIVNQLRDVLLEMEQGGFVDIDTTDELDEKHDGDWTTWSLDVIDLPDFPEEGLNNILSLQENSYSESEDEFEDEFDDNDEDEDEDEGLML